jgi:uncharacterized protein
MRFVAVASAALLSASCAALAQQVPAFAGLPGDLSWQNTPLSYHIEKNQILTISAGPKTDWFVDPFDGTVANTAPILLFEAGGNFVLSVNVQATLNTKWDAGAIMLWADDHHWAKLSLELSPEGKPTMVTVVTRGLSDDCNSIAVSGNAVDLQVAKSGQAYVFYSSEDGRSWHILRTFSLDTKQNVRIGFESQSPAGSGASAVFSQIHYSPSKIANIYTGK